MIDLKFPEYNGLESQYEHNVYAYLEKVLTDRNYVFRVKKTDISNIDENIRSVQGLANGKCDAYINLDDSSDTLMALVELESTGKIKSGITQIISYAKSLADRYKVGRYKSQRGSLLMIVFDGQKIWISEYNLGSDDINIIISSSTDERDGIQFNNEHKDRLLSLFPKKEKVKKTQVSEKRLIKRTKEIIRGNKDLQAYKIVTLTIFVSIYTITKDKDFHSAIAKISRISQDRDADIHTRDNASGILSEYNTLKGKLDVSNKPELTNKLEQLYEEIAIGLYDIFKYSNLDLYALIYEEFAEKNSKKEEGEYYTQRHITRPPLNAIFIKYLIRNWGLTGDKESDIKKINEKVIADIFVGSGGMLYSFIKNLVSRYGIKNDNAMDVTLLKRISQNSIYGIDKNDPISAFFNLLLIGAGDSNINQVQTSINWQEAWKYKVQQGNCIRLDKHIKNRLKGKMSEEVESAIEHALKEQIDVFRGTFISFIKLMIDFKLWKTKFSLSNDIFGELKTVGEFISKVEELEGRNSMFYNLIKSEYLDSEGSVIKLVYDYFVKYSINSDNVPSYDEFCISLGTVDFLPTNVPYGNIDDPRFKNEYGSRLESVALKECIDLLRPSNYGTGYINNGTFIDDPNGEIVSFNNGGIGAIIVPNGIFERGEDHLLDYMQARCNILSVIKLPFYAFSPYALVQTYFVVIQKKAVPEFNTSSGDDRKVFMYIADNDGKANSDKRFNTKNISPVRVEIKDKDGNVKTHVHEYLHDDFEQNIEKYPEDIGYLSRLERAWIYGNSKTVSKDWNQIRINEKWNGKRWEVIDGKKWGYFKLEDVESVKQVEKKSKAVVDAIKEILEIEEEFEDLTIDEQKILIVRKIKEPFIEQLVSIKKSNNKIEVSPSRISNKRNMVDFIIEYFKNNETVEIINDDMEDFKQTLYDAPVDGVDNITDGVLGISFTKTITDLLLIVKSLSGISILEDEISLYQDIKTIRKALLPEHYLLTKKSITEDEIKNTLIRFSNML